jgi:hypothetical protein
MSPCGMAKASRKRRICRSHDGDRMAEAFAYKSIIREHSPGAGYASIAEFLNPEGADGWECFAVLKLSGLRSDENFECFYLKKKIPPNVELR